MLQLIHPETYGKMKVEDIRSPHGKKGEEGYKYLSEWPKEEQAEILKKYYKFMFVRHPLERLLSAYRDKVRIRMSHTLMGTCIESRLNMLIATTYVMSCLNAEIHICRSWNISYNS